MAEAQIAANCKTWGEMIKAGNAKGLTELYTEDCRNIPAGMAPLIGREAFQKFVQDRLDAGLKDAKLDFYEIDPLADTVKEGGTFWERGHYIFYTEGGVEIDTGDYVAIWKKVSGKCLCYIDMFHSNKK